MGEHLAHLWDELDDVTGVCRHVATCTAAELLSAAPLIAAVSGTLLAGAATLLLSHRPLVAVLT
jgi:hypothetical protein